MGLATRASAFSVLVSWFKPHYGLKLTLMKTLYSVGLRTGNSGDKTSKFYWSRPREPEEIQKCTGLCGRGLVPIVAKPLTFAWQRQPANVCAGTQVG